MSVRGRGVPFGSRGGRGSAGPWASVGRSAFGRGRGAGWRASIPPKGRTPNGSFPERRRAGPLMDAALNKIRTGFFARHETFAPRYGWLKKGFDGVAGVLPGQPDQLDERAESPSPPAGGDSLDSSRPETDAPPSTVSEPPGDPGVFDRDEAIEILGVGKNMVRSIRFWCMAFHLIEPEKHSDSPRVSGPMGTTALGGALLAEGGWDPYLEDPASLWLLHWKLFAPPIVAPDLPDRVFLAACLDFAAHRGGVDGAGGSGGSKTLSPGAIAYERNGPGRVFQLSETGRETRFQTGTDTERGPA